MNLIVYKNKPSLKQGFFVLGLIVILVLWILLLNFINYRCPIHELLDLYCPGCGGTRMLVSFFKLDFYQSFRWNPLLFVFLVIFIIYLIVGIIIFVLVVAVIVLTVLLVSGSTKKVVKIKDGKEVIVKFGDGNKMTADDIWDKFKESYILSVLLNEIDKKILNEEYKKKKKEIQSYLDQSLTQLKSNYTDEDGNYDEDALMAALSNAGYSTIDDYLAGIRLSKLK